MEMEEEVESVGYGKYVGCNKWLCKYIFPHVFFQCLLKA